MQEIGERIVQDLRQASAWLLEAAGTSGLASTKNEGRGPLLAKIRVFAALVPGCLREIEEPGARSRATSVLSRTPQRARASRSPRDFVYVGQQWLPLRWERDEPLAEPDPGAVAWLLHLWEALWAELEQTKSRIGTQLARALQAMPPEEAASDFEIQMRDRLIALEDRLEGAERTLLRTRGLVLRATGTRLASSPRRPVPYPVGISWVRLGQVSTRILDPRAELPETLRALVDGEAELAELPFLYQRWCGLQVVEALARLGWESRRDPVPALFLGGRIDFVPPGGVGTEPAPLRLWVEPRLPPRTSDESPHESGVSCLGSEPLRPDYLFVVQDVHGPEAYVLDPTFTTVALEAEEKGKYRSRLAFDEYQIVVGVPTRKPPRRSFAAQPLRRPGNRLLDAEGRLGIVPLHPLERDWTGLEAWLRDLLPQRS